MADNKIPYKIYLTEDEIPKQWYNVRADMKNKPAPLPARRKAGPMPKERETSENPKPTRAFVSLETGKTTPSKK